MGEVAISDRASASTPPSTRIAEATDVGKDPDGSTLRDVGRGPELVGIASTYWSTAETPSAGSPGGTAAEADDAVNNNSAPTAMAPRR